VRAILPLVTAPTLVVHRTGDQLVNIRSAGTSPSTSPARASSSFGSDHAGYAGAWTAIVDEVQDPHRGPRSADLDRVLATVMFTESRLHGESRHPRRPEWRELLDEHDKIVARIVEQFRGVT